MMKLKLFVCSDKKTRKFYLCGSARERLLTPSIVVYHDTQPDDDIPVSGVAVVIGWWKWGAGVMLLWSRPTTATGGG